jgi:hypothetical protein
MTASECAGPALIARTPVSPGTAIGNGRNANADGVRVLNWMTGIGPTPSWPLSPRPHAYTWPSRVSAST